MPDYLFTFEEGR